MTVGRTLCFLAAIACVSGAIVWLRPTPSRSADLVWTFSPAHAEQVRTIASSVGDVDVALIASRALDVRLQSLDDTRGTAATPSLVEIEIGSVGKYFGGTVDDVPFVPLTDRLRAGGWLERLSAARLAAWSKGGEIFGVPLDVHPVSLTYRKDLFDAAGVDLSTARTWTELHERCLQFEALQRRSGRHTRALQLPSGSADVLVMMLQQRGVNLIDDRDQPRLSDRRVAETVAFYARLVAGPRRVSTDASPGPGRWAEDLARGDVAAALTPDWALADLRAATPSLAGKLAMIPLPRFDPSDAPTASWGGTMVAIPRACPDVDAAWRLLERLYLSDAARQARGAADVLPAVTDWWDDPIRARPEPLYGGQPIGAVYVSLARQLPRRVVTPFTSMATSALSMVLYRTTAAIERGESDEAVDAQLRQWLIVADADLQRRIGFANLGQ